MEKVRSIQAARLLAAAAVVHTHAVVFAANAGFPATHASWGYVAEFGAVGVDVFFVISGFIIAETIRRSQPSAADFLKRRFLRVAPIYWLLSVPWIIIAVLAGAADIWKVLATFAFMPVSPKEVVAPFLNVGWTLCFEMLFYLCAGLALLRGVRWWWFVAGYAVCLALGLMLDSPLFHFLGQPLILEFLAGIVISTLWDRGMANRRVLGCALLALAVALFGWTIFHDMGDIGVSGAVLNRDAGLARAFWWGVPSAAFIAGLLQFESAFKGRWAGPLVVLGEASYALYLVHLLSLEIMERIPLTFAFGGDAAVVIMIAGAILSGWLTWMLIQKPLDRLLRGKRPAGKQPAPS